MGLGSWWANQTFYRIYKHGRAKVYSKVPPLLLQTNRSLVPLLLLWWRLYLSLFERLEKLFFFSLTTRNHRNSSLKIIMKELLQQENNDQGGIQTRDLYCTQVRCYHCTTGPVQCGTHCSNRNAIEYNTDTVITKNDRLRISFLPPPPNSTLVF